MSHNSPVIKAKRKAICSETKIKILYQLATGQGAMAVGKHFGIHEATLRTIKKNETAIRKSVCSGTKISAKSSNIWPECVKSKDPDPVIHNNASFTDITTLAHTIGGNVFDDLSFADIEELLADKSLSENEIIYLTLETRQGREHSNNGEEDPLILNAIIIKESIDLARKLGINFEQHDPDEERAAEFQRELKSLMLSYRELYNGLLRNQTQSLMADFLLKTTELSTQETRDDNPELISQDGEQNNSSGGSDILVLRKCMCMRLTLESDNA